MTIADNLQTLIDCKTDMKSAIESKGVTVSGGLSTYADAIREIDNSNELIIKCEQGLKYNLNDSSKTLILDASNITDASGLCANGGNADDYNSAKKITILNLHASNISQIFGYNVNLETIEINTSNVTNMRQMFVGCSKLTSIPQLDTSNATNMSQMFYSCSNLNSIPQLDTSNVINIEDMFYNCSNLTDLGGFKDLGKVSSFNEPESFLNRCRNLTKESVMNVINNLYDRKSAGYSVIALRFYVNTLNLLSDEEKAIATNKGWTLTT